MHKFRIFLHLLSLQQPLQCPQGRLSKFIPKSSPPRKVVTNCLILCIFPNPCASSLPKFNLKPTPLPFNAVRVNLNLVILPRLVRNHHQNLLQIDKILIVMNKSMCDIWSFLRNSTISLSSICKNHLNAWHIAIRFKHWTPVSYIFPFCFVKPDIIRVPLAKAHKTFLRTFLCLFINPCSFLVRAEPSSINFDESGSSAKWIRSKVGIQKVTTTPRIKILPITQCSLGNLSFDLDDASRDVFREVIHK